METRRRLVMEAASWCSVAYPTVADVVDLVFNLIRPVLLVCPSSVVAVQVAVREFVSMSVRLDPQHTPVSSGVCPRGDMYSGGISTGQFTTRACSRLNSRPYSTLVK